MRSGQVACHLAVVLSLTGCEAGYYAHLVRGQARVLWRTRPVEAVRRRPDLGPRIRDGLVRVDSLRAFAARVGLAVSTNYARYLDTGGRPLSWNVSASAPDRFAAYQWHFPLLGDLPYKGFFDEGRARREAERLRRDGLDVWVGPVPAYSTLGYLSDPVLSTMLELPEDELAELILHELTHATVYARQQVDYDESLATFVGRTGALAFLCLQRGPDDPLVQRAAARQAEEGRFQEYVAGVIDALDSLYQAGLARDVVLERRRQVFARAQEQFRLLQPQFEVVRYDGFLRWEVNNALLLGLRRYHRDLGAFADVHRAHGGRLDRSLPVFVACGRAADPWACLRASRALATAPALAPE